jgi:putative DNA methylase
MRKVLIDEWFPIEEVSVESVRERSVGQNPAPNRLHVWFARRPLTTSRASIVTSILSDLNRKQILDIMGIPPHKDLRAAQRSMNEAKARVQKLEKNPFEWKRAFTHVPTTDELNWLHSELHTKWEGRLPIILDPMAGGGSIPYEAATLGLPVIAGDLNPVAFVILKATVEYPAKYKERLIPAIQEFCVKVHDLAKKELAEFFPKAPGEKVYAYLWARTVRCQACNLIIPLSPNWWIVRENKETDIAVKLIIPKQGKEDVCSFEIVENPKKNGLDPDRGTDVRKEAQCPRCSAITSGEEVKKMAQSGKMGHQMFAVCTKRSVGVRKNKWHYRTPTGEEIESVKKAEERLRNKIRIWEEKGLVPNTKILPGEKMREPLNFGMKEWKDMFSPRQLLSHLTHLEKYEECKRLILESSEDPEFARAVCVYGAVTFDTCIDYNCLLSSWESTRQVLKHLMTLQAFPIKSSYAEFDHSDMLWPWAQTKVLGSLKELVEFLPAKSAFQVCIYNSDSSLIPLDNGSVDVIVVDPPYGNNVMYAEVSDFFYVWLRRMMADIFPDSFKNELTNKIDEAVANRALYRDTPKAKDMADQHYYSKMLAAFREMSRVLRDDGVLTVMFTHREVEAWTGLAKALSDAGFTFRSSWPVLTEPADKFGKADKGVLKVTIILSCRKREVEKRGLWSEVQRELQEEADKKVFEYSERGLQGMNLLVSIYGPVLGKFTDYSIVKDAYGNVIGPEQALDVVSEAINRFNTAEISGSDLTTLAYVNLLKNFPSLTVESDLARVTTVFGGRKNVKELESKGGNGLVETKAGKVTILLSKERLASGHIDLSKPETFKSIIDIVHAALRLYEGRGVGAVKELLSATGKDAADSGFISVLKVIRGIGTSSGAAKRLADEANTASLLLEALGQQPEGVMKKGERMDHYLRGQTTFNKEGKLTGDKDLGSF